MKFHKWQSRPTNIVFAKMIEEVGEVGAELAEGYVHPERIVEELDHVIGIATILRGRFAELDKSN